jgi:hypothetical protein
VLQIVDMPNRTVDLLHRVLSQNKGTLSKRARTQEFKLLADEEVLEIEQGYATAFADVMGRPAEEEPTPEDAD